MKIIWILFLLLSAFLVWAALGLGGGLIVLVGAAIFAFGFLLLGISTL